MNEEISVQIVAVSRFVDWRRRNGRTTPIEEDLRDYEQHLEVEGARARLAQVRLILDEPFDRHDPNVLERLRGIVA